MRSWLLWMKRAMCCALCSKMKTAGAGLAGRPGPAAAGPAGTQRSVGEPSSSSTSRAGTPLPGAPQGSCRWPRRRISATSHGSMGSVVRLSRHDEPTYHNLKRFSPGGAGCGSGSGSRGWESGSPSPRFSMAGVGRRTRGSAAASPGARCSRRGLRSAGAAAKRASRRARPRCRAASCLPARGQPAGRGRTAETPHSYSSSSSTPRGGAAGLRPERAPRPGHPRLRGGTAPPNRAPKENTTCAPLPVLLCAAGLPAAAGAGLCLRFAAWLAVKGEAGGGDPQGEEGRRTAERRRWGGCRARPPRPVRRSSRALSELVLIQTSQESLGRRVSARSGVPGHLLPAAASLSRPPVPLLVLPCEEKQPRRSRAYGSLPPRTAESRVSLRLILTLFFFLPKLLIPS